MTQDIFTSTYLHQLIYINLFTSTYLHQLIFTNFVKININFSHINKMVNFAVFDVTKWPVVHVKLTGIPRCVEDFEDYLTGFDLLYENKQCFNLIIDSTDIGQVSMYYIARLAFHMHSREDKTKEYIGKVAIVVTTDFVTTLLNALFLMKKPVSETVIFNNIIEAKDWVIL